MAPNETRVRFRLNISEDGMRQRPETAHVQ